MKNKKGLFIKDPNFWRIPRKKKKLIPKNTHYCYTPVKAPCEENNWVYEIKPCSFFDFKKIKDMEPKPEYMDEEFVLKYGEERQGWCKLIKYEIEDRCKSCNLKY